MSNSSSEDLKAFIRERWAHLRCIHPSLGERRFDTELKDVTPDEERGFFAGLREGLFSVGGSEGVRFEYQALGGGPSKDIFEGGSRSRAFRREYVLQFATASRLVLEEGWPPNQVKVEPVFEPGEWAVDIALYEAPGRAGQWFAAIECKAKTADADQLAGRIRQCGTSGEGDVPACTVRSGRTADTAHKNYRALLRQTPPWFCTVAPVGAKLYRVEYPEAGQLELQFAGSRLPRRP